MRIALTFLASFLVVPAFAAEPKPVTKPVTSPSAQQQQATAPKPAAVDQAMACAAYGEGFVAVAGTTTCVRVGGYVRAQGGVTR